MAIDWALLRLAQEGSAALRLYRWHPPCLSFGRNEPASARYDRDEIARLGLDAVRRPTGGRAVWHEHEVTYAVAAPQHVFGSLGNAYLSIHEMLAGALNRIGAPAVLAAPPTTRLGPPAGPCFAVSVGGEIVVGGRKLVGSAQVRERGALLQHGSLLLEDGQDLVARVTRRAAGPSGATSLQAVLGRAVHFEEVANAMVAEARAAWGGTWSTDTIVPTTDDLARFADAAWTWRR
jgi:lipoate-protein ligase A